MVNYNPMFADVVLHRKMPAHLDRFTYEIPGSLKLSVGQFVTVPFRKQKIPGVVIAIHNNKPAYPTKAVQEVLPETLNNKQLQIASWMSKKYSATFSKIFDLFIPNKIWEPSPDENEIKTEQISNKTIRAKTDQKIFDFFSQAFKTAKSKLIWEKEPLEREKMYASLKKLLPEKGQALILVPEQFHIKKISGDFSIYHGELSDNEKASVWKSVKTGESQIVAGTRSALFLPFKNLSLIVVDYEDNESFNEKRSPAYNAADVAEKIAELWSSRLLFVSSAPRIETWHKTKENLFELHEWKNSNKKSPEITVADMADERKRGNFEILAAEAVEKIARALSLQKQALIFVNRKGEAAALFCRDCAFIFRCPRCDSPLTVNAGILKCSRCKVSQEMPVKCAQCDGLRLKQLGFGTAKLEKEIKKKFERAKILRLDSETASTKKMKKEALEEENLKTADILIATQMIDKPLKLPRLDFSLMTSTDSMLSYSDFRSGERLFRLLVHIKNMTAGEMLIQTYMPSHPLYEFFKKGNLEKFYESELNSRKSLRLPPFNTGQG